ncbi:MAG: YdcF family protein [Chitinophagaceae bacterium]|nr:MAG: YdcF family protein [Chitinophagaceae bacterium]
MVVCKFNINVDKSYLMRVILYMKKSIYTLLLAVGIFTNSYSSGLTFYKNDPGDTVWTASTDSIILNKAFYLFAVFNQEGNIREFLQQDKVLEGIADQKIKEAGREINNCNDVSCYASLLKWTPHEIYLIGNELVNMADQNATFRDRLVHVLEENGGYINYEKYGYAGMIRAAWYDCALGTNYILNVYIKGMKPIYALIDSISFAPNDPHFKHLIYESFHSTLRQLKGGHDLFFALPIRMALLALRLNGRNEVARYEPMKAGMNALPYAMIKHTQWAHYRYSAILIPGEGPERVGVSLNPVGAFRCRLAAKRFKKGLAPFIITSGGHVHPYKTPFSEAVEMKKYLVDSLHIPASAVIIEPHARHTTTNIRNTCRIIIHFGIPIQKPVLIVTDTAQNNYISSIDERNRVELGYLPYAHLRRIGPNETVFFPVQACMQENPFDPLDP